jgi:hypothetical protein
MPNDVNAKFGMRWRFQGLHVLIPGVRLLRIGSCMASCIKAEVSNKDVSSGKLVD